MLFRSVLHEFSTIPGVVEDVTEIVLNVKGIVAKLHAAGPKTVVIDVVGSRDVTAGDIKADSDLEVLNPEHHICTVGENDRFYMELTFDAGRGYISQERNKQIRNSAAGATSAPIGTIYTDSIYTPVYSVSYTVDNTRVGTISDYDKLTLEVETNGTISAREAISLGAKILNEHLNLFVELSDEAKKAEIMVEMTSFSSIVLPACDVQVKTKREPSLYSRMDISFSSPVPLIKTLVGVSCMIKLIRSR